MHIRTPYNSKYILNPRGAPSLARDLHRRTAVSTRSESLDRRRDDMTTTAQLLTQGSLRLQSGRGPGGSNPEAWKSMVGNKPVSAHFTLLPNTKPRMSALGTSLIIQIALAAFFVIVPLLFPQQMIPSPMYMVTEIAGPPLDIPAPPQSKPPTVEKFNAQA